MSTKIVFAWFSSPSVSVVQPNTHTHISNYMMILAETLQCSDRTVYSRGTHWGSPHGNSVISRLFRTRGGLPETLIRAKRVHFVSLLSFSRGPPGVPARTP